MVVLLFLIGLIFGSFANVVIHRLPVKQSIAFPSSKCPDCLEPIKPYDNIPVISYILLRGRCRNCGNKIPVRYPLVELLCAILFAALYVKFDFGAQFFKLLPFVFGLVLIAFIDLEHKIIPNAILFLLLPYGLLAMFFPATIFLNLLWAAGVFILFLIVKIIQPAGMGLGDVKLSFVIGLYLGVQSLAALFIAFLSGGLVSIALLIFKGKNRKDQIPLGPFLAFGSIAAIFFGQQIMNWYLGFL